MIKYSVMEISSEIKNITCLALFGAKYKKYVLLPVGQIWAMEGTETSRGKKKLIDAGFMFNF